MKHLTVEEGDIRSGELGSDRQAQEVIEAGDVILKQDAINSLFSLRTRQRQKALFLKSVANALLPTPCFHDGSLVNYAKYYYGDSWPAENTLQVTQQQQQQQRSQADLDPRGEKWDTSSCRTIRLLSKHWWK